MKEKKFTYHWVIVLACFLMMAASIGIVINCFNVFTVELMAEFGWDAGMCSSSAPSSRSPRS